jgi:hypothetical protein
MGLTKAEIVGALEKFQSMHKTCDTSYLLAVFFPEFSSPARVPTKFT